MLPSRGRRDCTFTLNNTAASIARKMLASRRELARTCPTSNLAQTQLGHEDAEDVVDTENLAEQFSDVQSAVLQHHRQAIEKGICQKTPKKWK